MGDHLKPAGLIVAALLALPLGVAAQTACAVFSEAAAVALVGGPLGRTLKHESRPDATNGHDHTTTCQFAPKGYHWRKA